MKKNKHFCKEIEITKIKKKMNKIHYKKKINLPKRIG